MKMISDLSWDLVEEILSKVPITCIGKVRSTCKRWNTLSKDRILCNSEARQQFLGFMVNNYRVCSVRLDLHGILNKDGRDVFAESSLKQIGNLVNQVEIRDVFHCDGLLLCLTRVNTSLVVWNPYLGQTRWIQPRSAYHGSDRYALGHDNNKNRNYKILRYLWLYKANHLIVECEIYDFNSDSWRVLDVTGRSTMLDQRSASLKGNSYFFAERMLQDDEYEDELDGSFLLCFDFTKESFGQFLHLPESHHDYDNDTREISSLREEKLVVLFQDGDTFVVDIWVTTKIEPNAVSWSKFLKFENVEALTSYDFCLIDVAGFFIEEEKKLAVVFDLGITYGIGTEPDLYYNIAFIIGENGYLKEVDLGEAVNRQEPPHVGKSLNPCPAAYSSFYVPSLVQINQIT